MLTFLLGRSGCGKTKRIIDEIEKSVAAGKRTYLLVPEQQLYLSECMLANLPHSSALCFEVISFSRLSELVFGKYGGISERAVGAGARHLIMWRTLRELSPAFKLYRGVRADSSFTAMMLSTLDELRSSSVRATDCQELAGSCTDGQLADKFSDIAAIYTLYEENLARTLGESAIAAEGKLKRLAEILRSNAFFADSHIFIDSFTSFTSEEHDVLKEMIRQAEDITVSLACERRSDAPHLESIKKTLNKLTRFADDLCVERQDVLLKSYLRSEKDELAILEENLWNFSVTEKNRPAVDATRRGAIEMHRCANEYEEISFAALNVIKERARGVEYSDIAIIMRSPETRKGIIEAVFEELDIPYFLSERTDLSTTAPARLILSALKCVAHNFNSSDVMTLIKTGLLGIDARDADLFEDYCYTWNINGGKFTEDAWSMNPDGYTKERSRRADSILESANRVRSTVIPPLEELRNQFSINKGDTVENCRAIYKYLSHISLPENISAQAERMLESGDLKGAGEALRLYDYIISALTDVSTSLADCTTGADDLATAIEIMLRHTDIGSVPATSDCVTIGSAATLRVENVKTAIVLGLCEGEFPANYSDGGILNEHDKSEMENLGISLSSREDAIISDELFYAYRAMTKPSEKLILSTCKASISGKPLTPSSAWSRVAFLFPYISAHDFDLGAVRALLNAPKDDDNSGISENHIENDPAISVDPFYVRMLFGDKLELSKSKISSFAECPYKFWCEYVIGLREQSVSAVSYDSAGTIIHFVLESVLNKIKNEDGSLPPITDSEIIDLVDRFLKEYISEINCPLPPTTMYGFSRLRDLSLIMVRNVIKEFERSSFRIAALEKQISDSRPNSLKPIEIKLFDSEDSPRVSLTGVIDRIDFYEGEDKNYVRIVDYKTGSHRFDIREIATGADLQLPAYLFTTVLEENKGFFSNDKEIFPSGAVFLSAEESEGSITPVTSGFMLDDDELIHATGECDKNESSEKKDEQKITRAALSADDILNIDAILRDTVSTTAKSLYSGKIERTPSKDACKYCSVRSTCPMAEKEK